MGQGNAYPYKHHIILSLHNLYDGALPDDFESIPEDEQRYVREDCERDAYEFFKERLLECFNATEIDKNDPTGCRECHFIGETDRLYIGVDYTHDNLSCFYLVPKQWERQRYHKDARTSEGYVETTEIDYNLNADAYRGFNRLIKLFPDCLCWWTSSYTTSPYGTFGKSGDLFVKYNRKTEDTEQHA